MSSPIRPTDQTAREQAIGLIQSSCHAVLSVMAPGETHPALSRIALGVDLGGHPVSLISQLSQHTAALFQNPACGLLLGETGAKGDALTHPRLSLQCDAILIERSAFGFDQALEHYVWQNPKAKLYAGFADFLLARFEIRSGFLNAGFGKAYHLAIEDFAPQNAIGRAT